MPTIGTDIVGQSSEFNQTDWLTRNNCAFMAGKKNVYLSFFCKSDVSGTDNVPMALGVITGATPLYFRHNIDVAAVPNAWAWGYIFSDRSVRFESKANTGANNKLQHVAFQIQPGIAPRMWIDGVEQVAANITQSPPGAGYPTAGLLVSATNDHLMIGRGSVNTRLWDGLIDEVRMVEDVKDNAYVAIEFANLANIDDFIVSGDVETPTSKLSPIGELVIATAPTLATTRIKVDTYVTNPNSDPLVLTTVSAPNIGTAVRVNDSFVDYTAPSVAGQAKFNVTFDSGGKTIIIPVVINVSVGGVPPDITDLVLLADRVAWSTYVEPPGFQGYQPKESPSDAGTWTTGTAVGGLTPNKFVLKTALKTASRKVLVKPFANGIESINAAEISLVEIPTGVDYWSSPNYGTKARNDVGSHTELMNAIAGINPANAYINMTYTDGTATTINRGGTLANPLIISALAPNGPNNFTGRAGFNGVELILDADYVWLDRLSFRRPNTSNSEAISIRKNWKFITRCQIDSPKGIEITSGTTPNEWYIGFNRFTGLLAPGLSADTAGQVHIEAAAGSTGRPKNGRIYYNVFTQDAVTSEQQGYALMSGPGSQMGSPNVDYPGANVEGTWAHYNFIDVTKRWGIYLKHGIDCLYNHVARSNLHGLSTRGECVSKCKIKFNRVLSEQMSLQGWHHEVVGNIVPSGGGILLGCEFRNSSDTPKFTRGAILSTVIGNQSELCFGECRTFGDPKNPIMYAPLHSVVVEAHVGQFTRWISDSSRSPINVDANNKLPLSPVASGTNPNNLRYYDRDRITIRNTTTTPLEPPPVLSATICGPGSTRGKVWGT